MTKWELKVMCQVYLELNSIRASIGAPSNVCPDWWDELTESVDDIVFKHTGKQAWLNPLLYVKDLDKDTES